VTEDNYPRANLYPFTRLDNADVLLLHNLERFNNYMRRVMSNLLPKLSMLLLTVLGLSACKTVQPPAYPVANMFPTVDITAKLDTLRPCLISPEQLQSAMQSMHIWQLLQTAGLPPTEMPIVARGLSERGYAEIDARRASSPLLWVSFTSPAKNKLFLRAGFAKIPPYDCRQGLLLEKVPGDRNLRTLNQNGRQILQRTAVWQPYQRDDGQFQILQIFADQPNTVSHWEVYKEFTLPAGP